jgi:heme/copper-type cytochrome/quinol oxidase subunit 3
VAHAEAAHGGGHEVHDTTTGLSHKKLLMWAFLGSDCMFFGALIATYMVHKNGSLVGPFPEDVFDILTTSTSTFVLLMSSMSMVLAYNALTRGSLRGFRIWLLSTCVLGATFLAFQVFEFNEFVNYHVEIDCINLNVEELTDFEKTFVDRCDGTVEHIEIETGLTPRTNLFGTTFFVLTGFHGGHVTIGVIWLLSMYFYSFKKNGITSRHHEEVDVAALYWHFVDVVWIIIFTVVYLFGVFPGFD